jgi:hypothetical protein
LENNYYCGKEERGKDEDVVDKMKITDVKGNLCDIYN